MDREMKDFDNEYIAGAIVSVTEVIDRANVLKVIELRLKHGDMDKATQDFLDKVVALAAKGMEDNDG